MNTFYKILLFVSILFFCNGLSAQSGVKTGRAGRTVVADFRLGLNSSNVDVAKGDPYNKDRVGVQTGILVSYKFYKGLLLQTGFLATSKGMKHEEVIIGKDPITGVSTRIEEKYDVDANYAQVPLHLGYEHYFTNEWAVNVTAGLYGAFGVKGSQSGSRLATEITPSGENILENSNTGHSKTFRKGGLKKLDYGLGASVSVIYDIFAITAGYEHGLANISDTRNVELKTQNYYLSIGFRF